MAVAVCRGCGLYLKALAVLLAVAMGVAVTVAVLVAVLLAVAVSASVSVAVSCGNPSGPRAVSVGYGLWLWPQPQL